MATLAAQDERFDTGRAVERAMDALRERFGLLVALGLLLQFLPGVIIQLLTPGAIGATGQVSPQAARLAFGYTGVTGLIGLIMVTVSLGALTHAVIADAKPRLGDCLMVGLRRLFPILGLIIVMYFCIVLASFLLVVPGLILLTMWAVAIPVQTGERAGVLGSLGRSRALTKGARWPVFALLVALGLMYFLLIGFAALLAGGLDPVAIASLSGVTLGGIAYRLFGVVVWVLAIAVIGGIYLELVQVRDGHGGERLAAIFD